jgi:hypothetical protein
MEAAPSVAAALAALMQRVVAARGDRR